MFARVVKVISMRSHISWRAERSILYKDVEAKRTISTSGRLEPLQMVLEPDTRP